MSTRVVTYVTVRERVSERGVSGRVSGSGIITEEEKVAQPMNTQTPTRHDST